MTNLTTETLLEEAAIQRVLNRYASSLDARDWKGLDGVFTEDATAHYEGIGHFHGREAIVGLVRSVLDQCGPTQHLLGTVRVDVRGEEAEAKCYLQAIHVGQGDYEGDVMTVWGEYHDKLKRTENGWRISFLELSTIHSQGDIGLD